MGEVKTWGTVQHEEAHITALLLLLLLVVVVVVVVLLLLMYGIHILCSRVAGRMARLGA